MTEHEYTVTFDYRGNYSFVIKAFTKRDAIKRARELLKTAEEPDYEEFDSEPHVHRTIGDKE